MGSLLVVMLNGSMLPCFQVDVEWFHEAVLRAGVVCMPNFRIIGNNQQQEQITMAIPYIITVTQ